MNAMEDLLEAIDNMIIVDEVATEWREAIILAGELLVEHGRARERHIDIIIRTVEELGPYSVIAPSVATQQSRPEDDAIKLGFSIVILKEPVYFGPSNDPVHIVTGVTALNTYRHTRALKMLAVPLSSEEFIESIKKVKSKDDVKRVIREYSEKLLKQHST